MLTKNYEIVNGPSRMDLFVALAYAYDANHFFCVKMQDASGDIFQTAVTEISHEDGNGYSFNIKGRLERSAKSGKFMRYKCPGNLPEKFHGYYNAHTRHGYLVIEEPSEDQTIDSDEFGNTEDKPVEASPAEEQPVAYVCVDNS